MKSNPEIQIGKVSSYEDKGLIKLVKLFRTFNSFKFKSFYLEIFIIDHVSKFFTNEDNLYNKLVKFCKCYNDIGRVKLFDPANSANEITNIHDDFEEDIIRGYIKNLYYALLTNDDETILKCLKGEKYDLDNGYLNNARQHCSLINLNLNPNIINGIFLKGYYLGKDNNWYEFNSYFKHKKGTKLKFELLIPHNINAVSKKIIIKNAGYEAIIENKCPRGKEENFSYNGLVFYKEETALYYGNHYAQARIVLEHKGVLFSNLLTVRVR